MFLFCTIISFEIKLISKEVNCAEHKYMNMSPSLIELVTPLSVTESDIIKQLSHTDQVFIL